MADQNQNADIRDKPEQAPGTSNVFIIDNQTGTARAVSGVDKDGNLETVPANQKNRKNFMEVGQNSDVIDMIITSLKNFMKQAGDPTHFGFMRLAKDSLTGIGNDMKETAKNFRELFSGMFTDEADDLKNAANKIDNSTNNKNENDMAKKDQQTNKQEPQGEVNTDKRYRILPGMVDWESLKRAGLSKELLEKKGFLEDMLQGRKSPDTMNLNINLPGLRFQGEGKISLQKQENGTYGLRLHPVKLTPEFGTPYRGHVFSEEDKKNLLSTGNMGRVVDLEGPDFQMRPSVISLDKKTNEIHSMPTQYIYVPDEVAGVKLQKHEIDTIKAGGAVDIEGFTSKAGKPFDATLQYDAVNGKLAFRFDNGPGVYKKIGGVEIPEADQKILSEGGVIRVDDMKSRNPGETWDAFAKIDPVTNKLNLTSYNPDTPEGAREVIVPKYVGGVKLEEDQRQDMAAGRATFVDGMTNRNGESYERFVKLHPESGRVMTSKYPDGFDETQKPKLNIPDQMFGEKITAKMRAALQDGKTVHLKNAIGTDGSAMPIWLKANKTNTAINTYPTNPDEKKNAAKTAVIPNAPQQSEKNKSGQKM